MPSEPHSASVSSSALWAGGIITGLVVLFLLFDGVTKIIKVTPVVQACDELGVPGHTVVGIGMLLVACTVIYATPQTAVLGAILLTGYLGGAVATNLLTEQPIVSTTLFPIYTGIFVWGGLWLRDLRVRRIMPVRRG